MNNYKIGFIGCGNMAQAIICGIQKTTDIGNIYLYDIDKSKTDIFKGANICSSVEGLALAADIIFLCVKPNILPTVLKEVTADGKAFVSIAAGVKSSGIKQNLKVSARIMRVMPNTPMMVSNGAICVQTPNNFEQSEQEFVYNIFSDMGEVFEVSEDQMDTVTGVSGSGPAYVYYFIDSVAKAGEANGLSYELALKLATQTFIGACEMLKSTDKLPEKLISEVCSPNGTTIEAMNVLREKQVESFIKDAVDACVRRSVELSK